MLHQSALNFVLHHCCTTALPLYKLVITLEGSTVTMCIKIYWRIM